MTILKYAPFAASTGVCAACNNGPPMERGSMGKSVKVLQDALKDLGYDLHGSYSKAKEPDGNLGHETEEAVRTFQADREAAVDGIAGRETVRELDRLMVAIHGRDPSPPRPEYAGPAPAPGGATGPGKSRMA